MLKRQLATQKRRYPTLDEAKNVPKVPPENHKESRSLCVRSVNELR